MDIMKKSTRSILQELSDIGINRNKDYVIDSRGSNLIESAINLILLIHENYDYETAADLEKRFINAIRSNDIMKYKQKNEII
jgi:hypothetical protein